MFGNNSWTKKKKPKYRDSLRRYVKWTNREDVQLMREARQGLFLEDIARIHNRTIGGIETRAQKLRLGVLKRRPSQPGTQNNTGVISGARMDWKNQTKGS